MNEWVRERPSGLQDIYETKCCELRVALMKGSARLTPECEDCLDLGGKGEGGGPKVRKGREGSRTRLVPGKVERALLAGNLGPLALSIAQTSLEAKAPPLALCYCVLPHISIQELLTTGR